MAENKVVIILKITGKCNLSCKYCYDSKKTSELQLKDIATIYNHILPHFSHVDISWHGGEPLLVGLDFFKQAIDLQKEYSCSIDNYIQTNGTLFDENFIDFFKNNNFTIGISYDNIFQDQREANNSTLSKIKLLKSKSVNFGIISVISTFSKQLAELWYSNYKSLGTDTQVNVLTNYSNNESHLTEEYIEGLERLFDLWYFDDSCNVDLKPFSEIVGMFFGVGKRPCYFGQCLYNFISVSSDKELSFCDKSRYHLLSLDQLSEPDDFFDSPAFEDVVLKMIDRQNQCKKTCSYYPYCVGGCVYEAFNQMDTRKRCYLRRRMFKHVFSIVEKDISLNHCNPHIQKCVKNKITFLKQTEESTVWICGERVYKHSKNAGIESIVYHKLSNIVPFDYYEVTDTILLPYLKGHHPDFLNNSNDLNWISKIIEESKKLCVLKDDPLLKHNKKRYLERLQHNLSLFVDIDLTSQIQRLQQDSHNVVHGDLTPRNIIIDKTGVSLIDYEWVMNCSSEFDVSRLIIYCLAKSIESKQFPGYLNSHEIKDIVNQCDKSLLKDYFILHLFFQYGISEQYRRLKMCSHVVHLADTTLKENPDCLDALIQIWTAIALRE